MNSSFENYESKIDSIITNIKKNNKNIKNNNKIIKTHKKEIIEETLLSEEENDELNDKPVDKNTKPGDKDFYCKQLDSLNYCLEMHKVRKNKKADFDIHNTEKYSIEDKNIDKQIEVLTWKELPESLKKESIMNFINEISNNHNIEVEYTTVFVNNNLNKIKYDKYKGKIVDLYGMINCIENNINILKIKPKMSGTVNSRVNKLRKALSTSKKSRFTVDS
tara:strand:+ start:1710 stop:2369 length:660 start_codon:yes stop_codon:yes gene_type:complete